MKNKLFPPNTIIIYLFLVLSLMPFSLMGENGMAEAKVCAEKRDSLILQIERATDADFVNIWIIPPMGCPRCEGVASITMALFRTLSPNEKHIVWIDQYYTSQLKQYLKDRNYPADTILDARAGIPSEWLSVNLGQFQTPHYIRYNRIKKTITDEKPLLGASISELWVKDRISEKREPVEIISCGSRPTVETKIPVGDSGLFTEINKFIIPGDLPDFFNLDISPDRSEIALVDNFSWDLVRLQKKEEKCSRVNVLAQLPLDTFISPDAPPAVVRMMKKSGMINNMVFSPRYTREKNALLLGISLPKIEFANDAIAYYNEAVIVRTQWDQSRILGAIEKDSTSNFQPTHTRFYPAPGGKQLYVKCTKGWPVSGSAKSVEPDSPDNPFRNDFYSDVPVFALTERTGRITGTLGRLDEMHQKTRTGYFYMDLSAAFHRDTLFYTTGYSGKIYSQYQDAQPVFSCPEFNWIYSNSARGMMRMEDGKSIPILPSCEAPVLELEPDSQLNYILNMKDLLTLTIDEFGINDRQVAVITREGEKRNLTWKVYDRGSARLLQEFAIPEYQSGGHLCAALVGRDERHHLYLEALYLNGNTLHWCSREAVR